MPYMIAEQDGKFKVYKRGTDGPSGSSLGEHPDKAKAQAQIDAINISEARRKSAKSISMKRTVTKKSVPTVKSAGVSSTPTLTAAPDPTSMSQGTVVPAAIASPTESDVLQGHPYTSKGLKSGHQVNFITADGKIGQGTVVGFSSHPETKQPLVHVATGEGELHQVHHQSVSSPLPRLGSAGKAAPMGMFQAEAPSTGSEQFDKFPMGLVNGDSVTVTWPDGTKFDGKVSGYAAGFMYGNGTFFITRPDSQIQLCPSQWVTPKGSSTPATPSMYALDSIDQLVGLGSNVKALGDGWIGGHLILWGNSNTRDIYGDYFDKERTYLGPNDGDGRDTTINHRIGIKTGSTDVDEIMKMYSQRVFKPGGLKTSARDDLGVFAKVLCDLSDAYDAKIYEMANAGKLKWSAGAAPHMIDRDPRTGLLKMFVITEGALTPIPAEPRMMNSRVVPLKALLQSFPGNS